MGGGGDKGNEDEEGADKLVDKQGLMDGGRGVKRGKKKKEREKRGGDVFFLESLPLAEEPFYECIVWEVTERSTQTLLTLNGCCECVCACVCRR